MEIKSFRIQNYKGIIDTTIDLTGGKGAIHTLVGLNESGKTTILEAINNFGFRTKDMTDESTHVGGMHDILQQDFVDQSKPTFVPKGKKRNFTDKIQITADIELSDEDVEEISAKIMSTHAITVNKKSFQKNFTVIKNYKYQNSDFVEEDAVWSFDVEIKLEPEEVNEGDETEEDGGIFPGFIEYVSASLQRERIKEIVDEDYWLIFISEIAKEFPSIVYFPTFLFNFPEKILVSEEHDGDLSSDQDRYINSYFRSVLSEALRKADPQLKLREQIVDRVLKVDAGQDFASSWNESDAKEQVDATVAHLSESMTREIFGVWDEVIGTKIGEKKISIEVHPTQNAQAQRVVYLNLSISDGSDRFSITERSLGFRWFLSFLLFTKYFTGNKNGESIFLFDEPAANLHSMAQNKLMEVLPSIANDRNVVIYSTHSHYMIHPEWLERTYVISNGEQINAASAATVDSKSENGQLPVDTEYADSNANIQATKYRQFANSHANQPHYFQPILDKLQIMPIQLDARRGGVIVEGKSDYYILNWYKKHHAKDFELDFIPVGSAHNARSVLTYYLGTMQNFIILLDSDTAGKEAADAYERELPINRERILLFSDIVPGKKEIEDVFSAAMKDKFKEAQGDQKFRKKTLIPIFSEDLHKNKPMKIDAETLNNLKCLTDALLAKFKDMEF